MTLWMILTVMTAVAAVLIAAPFLRRLDGRSSDGQGGANIDRRPVDSLRRSFATARMAAVLAVTGITISACLGLYAINGRPDLSDTRRGGLLDTIASGTSDEGSQASGLAPVEEMIERLSLRLASAPADAEGWRMLGWSLSNTGRSGDAVAAYAKAVSLRPDSAEILAAYAETIVESKSGVVSPAAKSAFERTLILDAKNARARYFIGLAQKQAGDVGGALKSWSALLDDAVPGDEWASDVAEQARALAEDLRAGAKVTPGPVPEAHSTSKADEDPQMVMIRGMVDGLAKRLEASPLDEEGWIKLIRSYVVLGDFAAARGALNRASSVFAVGTAEHDHILASATQMGISGKL